MTFGQGPGNSNDRCYEHLVRLDDKAALMDLRGWRENTWYSEDVDAANTGFFGEYKRIYAEVAVTALF